MSRSEIRAWIRRHPEALPTTLADLSRFPMAFRRILVNEVSPDVLGRAGFRMIEVFMVAGLVACGGILVGPAQAVALHVRPLPQDGAFVMTIGNSLALEALPVASDSTVVGQAVVAAWRSNDTTIVSVTGQGVLQSHCAGSATVEATATVAGHSLSGTRAILVATTGPRCAP